jgi:hypothetical protein
MEVHTAREILVELKDELSGVELERPAYSGDSDHPYWFYPITCST